MSRVETNIVVVQVTTPENSDVICARMKEANVLAIPFGPRKIRFVTHLDVSTGDCWEALERVKKVVGYGTELEWIASPRLASSCHPSTPPRATMWRGSQ